LARALSPHIRSHIGAAGGRQHGRKPLGVTGAA